MPGATERAAARLARVAAQTDGTQSLDLRRRAAELYLRGGYLDKGVKIVVDVLEQVRLRYPRSRASRIATMLWWRARLRTRGLRHNVRLQTDHDPAALLRLDACLSSAHGLAYVDYASAAAFAARGLLLALRAGEPSRIIRLLLVEACFVATAGTRGDRRAHRLLTRARRLISETGDRRQEMALHAGAEGFVAYQLGRFAEARAKCQRSLDVLSEGPMLSWEVGVFTLIQLASLHLLGDVEGHRRVSKTGLTEAEQRGDLFTLTNMRTLTTPLVLIADDEPELARQEAAGAVASWGNQHQLFTTQHFVGALALAKIAIYTERPGAAFEQLRKIAGPARASLLSFVQGLRILYSEGLATAALGAAAAGALDRRQATRVARLAVRRLLRERARWASGLAHLVKACADGLQGRLDAQVESLRSAIETFDGAEMSMHAAACRCVLGRRIGGDEGDALIAASDRWAHEHRIRQAQRVYSMLLPAALT